MDPHGNPGFFLKNAVFENIPLVMFSTTPCQCDFYLNEGAFEIKFRWNERKSFFFNLERESEYIPSFEKEFPVSGWQMVKPFSFSFIGTDMRREQDWSTTRE